MNHRSVTDGYRGWRRLRAEPTTLSKGILNTNIKQVIAVVEVWLAVIPDLSLESSDIRFKEGADLKLLVQRSDG